MLKQIRLKAFMALALLAMVCVNAYADGKQKKLTKGMFYEGIMQKKIPVGQGTLSIFLPEYNETILKLSGEYNGNQVENANVDFDGDFTFTGSLTYVLDTKESKLELNLSDGAITYRGKTYPISETVKVNYSASEINKEAWNITMSKTKIMSERPLATGKPTKDITEPLVAYLGYDKDFAAESVLIRFKVDSQGYYGITKKITLVDVLQCSYTFKDGTTLKYDVPESTSSSRSFTLTHPNGDVVTHANGANDYDIAKVLEDAKMGKINTNSTGGMKFDPNSMQNASATIINLSNGDVYEGMISPCIMRQFGKSLSFKDIKLVQGEMRLADGTADRYVEGVNVSAVEREETRIKQIAFDNHTAETPDSITLSFVNKVFAVTSIEMVENDTIEVQKTDCNKIAFRNAKIIEKIHTVEYTDTATHKVIKSEPVEKEELQFGISGDRLYLWTLDDEGTVAEKSVKYHKITPKKITIDKQSYLLTEEVANEPKKAVKANASSSAAAPAKKPVSRKKK